MKDLLRTSRIWLLPALVVLNLLLKFAWSGLNELAGDEPFTVYWAQRPLSELFGMLRTENNPPLYFLIMHGWSKLVPLEAAWLRIPSALFSALTVWPLYLLGRRLGGTTVAATAALLFTFSQHSYAFAGEVRAYSLLTLACTWAVWQLVRLADDPDRHPAIRPASIIWLVCANVLATWAHYFGWLMVGLEVVLVFTVPMLRPVRVKMLAAAGATALCSLPLLGILLARAGNSLGQGTWLQPPGLEEPYNMLVRWANAPVVAVILLALIVFAFARGRGRHQSLALPVLWTAIPLLGMFLVSFLFPIYLDRYLLFASIGFYLLVAGSASMLPGGRQVRWIMSAGCVLAMALTFKPWKGNDQHPSQVVAQVNTWRDGNTAVIIQPAWYDLTYSWAMDPKLYAGVAPVEMALRERLVFPVIGNEIPPLDSTLTTVVHIDAWASLTDPEQHVLNSLRAHYVQVDSVEADRKVWLRLFRKH